MRTSPVATRASCTCTSSRRPIPRNGSRGCPTGWRNTSGAVPARPHSTTGRGTRPCASSTSTPSHAPMPDFFDVVHRQRACRNFAPEAVPDDLVAQVLDAAVFAPSAENKQPWVFVVVRDDATRLRIAELTKQVWESGARAYEEAHLDPRILADVDQGTETGFASAPVVVVVGG